MAYTDPTQEKLRQTGNLDPNMGGAVPQPKMVTNPAEAQINKEGFYNKGAADMGVLLNEAGQGVTSAFTTPLQKHLNNYSSDLKNTSNVNNMLGKTIQPRIAGGGGGGPVVQPLSLKEAMRNADTRMSTNYKIPVGPAPTDATFVGGSIPTQFTTEDVIQGAKYRVNNPLQGGGGGFGVTPEGRSRRGTIPMGGGLKAQNQPGEILFNSYLQSAGDAGQGYIGKSLQNMTEDDFANLQGMAKTPQQVEMFNTMLNFAPKDASSPFRYSNAEPQQAPVAKEPALRGRNNTATNGAITGGLIPPTNTAAAPLSGRNKSARQPEDPAIAERIAKGQKLYSQYLGAVGDRLSNFADTNLQDLQPEDIVALGNEATTPEQAELFREMWEFLPDGVGGAVNKPGTFQMPDNRIMIEEGIKRDKEVAKRQRALNAAAYAKTFGSVGKTPVFDETGTVTGYKDIPTSKETTSTPGNTDADYSGRTDLGNVSTTYQEGPATGTIATAYQEGPATGTVTPMDQRIVLGSTPSGVNIVRQGNSYSQSNLPTDQQKYTAFDSGKGMFNRYANAQRPEAYPQQQVLPQQVDPQDLYDLLPETSRDQDFMSYFRTLGDRKKMMKLIQEAGDQNAANQNYAFGLNKLNSENIQKDLDRQTDILMKKYGLDRASAEAEVQRSFTADQAQKGWDFTADQSERNRTNASEIAGANRAWEREKLDRPEYGIHKGMPYQKKGEGVDESNQKRIDLISGFADVVNNPNYSKEDRARARQHLSILTGGTDKDLNELLIMMEDN